MDKWHLRYLRLANEVASWSKDTTQVGAVLVRSNRVLGVGYNGIPQGVEDLPERLVRPEKYKWIEHAEANCIHTAAREGVRLEGATIYSTKSPCASCARAIIQSGIKCVVTFEEKDERWLEDYFTAKEMFDEAGLEFLLL